MAWPLQVSGYSAAQTVAALHAARVSWDFRYDLLSASGSFKKVLTTVHLAGNSVKWTRTAAVRRTASFVLDEDPDVNVLSDRIRPWARLLMPDGGYAEWPLGVFLLTTPPRSYAAGAITRTIDGYDLSQVLQDDRVTDRYTVAASAVVTDAVAVLLTGAGIAAQNVTASAATLPATQDWELGTPKATIIADLLKAINYAPLTFDALGVAQVQPYVDPLTRPVVYRYADDSQSVLFADLQDGQDYWAVPNVFVLAVSQADRSVLRSVYTNSNPASPTSTVNRGRQIVTVDTSQQAVDQTTLDALAQRAAHDASQVAEAVPFGTGIMPFHGDEDVLHLVHSGLGLDGLYMETSWSFALQAGSRMSHSAQRIVAV